LRVREGGEKKTKIPLSPSHRGEKSVSTQKKNGRGTKHLPDALKRGRTRTITSQEKGGKRSTPIVGAEEKKGGRNADHYGREKDKIP